MNPSASVLYGSLSCKPFVVELDIRRRSTSQLVRDQLAGDKAEFPLAFLISTTRLGAAPIHAVAWNGRDTQLILVSRGASSRRIVSNHFSLVLALLSFESVTYAYS